MAPTTEQRRKFSRVPFDANVTIVGQNGKWRTSLIDISLKGVLIKIPENWVSNDDEILDVQIEEHGNAYTINMKATVEHSEEDTLGLSCMEIDIDSITSLRRLVELNLGDTGLLNRELAELCHQTR